MLSYIIGNLKNGLMCRVDAAYAPCCIQHAQQSRTEQLNAKEQTSCVKPGRDSLSAVQVDSIPMNSQACTPIQPDSEAVGLKPKLHWRKAISVCECQTWAVGPSGTATSLA